MRRGTGLRRRSASTNTARPATTSSDPNVDPPIVARLVQPMLALRASLGTGVSTPNAAIVAALTKSTTQAADTEAPHREGMQALESTWAGPAADAAVPALRTTRTQIGDISDRGPQYVQALTDAQATSSRAAQQVDGIIYGFRRDARTILSNAKAAPDTDAVITRATQALREAITAVNTAKTEMDGHTQKLTAMGPLTVTTPVDLSSNYSGDGTPTYSSDLSNSNGSNSNGSNNYGSNNYSPDNNASYTGAPNAVVNGGNSQPLDPATAAQLQLQEQLISAGVNVGSDAISAGVNIGSELIDKIAEVGEHAIDQGATVAEQAIPQLINPSSSGGTAGATTPSLFNFGGPAAQSTPAPQAGSGSIIPPTPGAAASSPPAPTNTTPGTSAPAPTPDPKPAPPPPSDTSTPAPPPPAAPPPAAGLALPPAPGTGGGDAKRDGQLGVTAPAAVEEMVPAAVIGDFGDDSF